MTLLITHNGHRYASRARGLPSDGAAHVGK